jgi:hypothetical protein
LFTAGSSSDGLLDLIGNVFEPAVSETGGIKLMGGAYTTRSSRLKSQVEFAVSPSFEGSPNIGIRPVRNARA